VKSLKNFILVIFAVTGLSVACFSQSATYKENLKKDIVLFESAKTANEFVYAANCFEKLAITEKNQWLPFYYAGLCDALAAFEKQHKDIDMYCDKADVCARIADSLSKNNSEIAVLKSMISAARINVNKAQRGQKYGLMASKFAAEALKLDDSNPRAHFVKGKAILNTPPTLGGGEKKAKPIFELVIEKEKTFKALSNLHPSWGREEAEKEIKKINLSTKK
jgi:hypothetical protein